MCASILMCLLSNKLLHEAKKMQKNPKQHHFITRRKKTNCTSVRFFPSVETEKAMGITNGGCDRDFLFRIMVCGIYLILCMLGYSLLASVFCYVCIVSVYIHWLCINNCECVSYVFYVAPTNFDFRFHHNFSFQYAGKHLTRPSFMRSLIKKKEHQKSTHKHGH